MTNVEKLREQVLKQGPVLTMNRVPKTTRDRFKKLAEDEFENDYGMCLKWILDRLMLLEDVVQSALFSNILAQHEHRLSQLEGRKDESKLKMLSGKEVKKDG